MSAVRHLAPGDEAALDAFLAAVPPGDRTFIKEDIADPSAGRAWIADADTTRGVATERDAIVGLVAIIPGIGWSSHVGDLRLVVHPGHRRRGVGTELARWAVLEATRMGLKKLVVEVVAEQEAAVAMFEGLGFEGEALLTDHIRDRDGNLRDLLLLSHRMDKNWSGLTTFGLGQ
jgi:ribosomal protein S18 acetylase RimI-like enzyme